MDTPRPVLPQLESRAFLTDGGIETTLVFLQGLELPHFAAFHLLRDAAGRIALEAYFRTYLELARRHGAGLVLESPTWRANYDWGAKLGYDFASLADANREAIAMLHRLRAQYADPAFPIVVSGCFGPRGDGYVPAETMDPMEAHDYHLAQARAFAEAGADMGCAITMNTVEEATGIAEAARTAGLPVAVSFTVETDGRLPGGASLREAIEAVDRATGAYPAYYMVNCAHPSHFAHVLEPGSAWTDRIRGVRANASRLSHAELNDSPTLDAGDPDELGRDYAALKRLLPQLSVLGGCCGTDHRHVERIAAACMPLFAGDRVA